METLMGILPNFNKIGSHRTLVGWSGDPQNSSSTDLFLFGSYTPHLFNFYYCIEIFHQGGFTVSFNSHSSVTAGTFWPFSKQAWPSHPPQPPEPLDCASAYFWFGRKSLTCWITSSTSCGILGKTTVGLGRILKHFTDCGFWITKDGKFWVLLCVIHQSTTIVLSWKFPVITFCLSYSQPEINKLNKQGCPTWNIASLLPTSPRYHFFCDHLNLVSSSESQIIENNEGLLFFISVQKWYIISIVLESRCTDQKQIYNSGAVFRHGQSRLHQWRFSWQEPSNKKWIILVSRIFY